MKIALINTWKSTHPHLGLGYIASYLRKKGFTDILIIEENEPLTAIRKFSPDVVGFFSYTPNYSKVLTIAMKVKKELGIPVILGGPHISSLPHKLDNAFDIGVLGEAEQTMAELMNLLRTGRLDKENLSLVDGICYHSEGHVIVNKERGPIKNLDEIPFPARDLLDMKYYLSEENDILSTQEKIRGTTIITSRGCPYRCIYCQSKKLFPVARYHSAEYVAREIKELYYKYNAGAIAIDDDLFIANKKRLIDIVELLEKAGILGKIKFYCSARANLVNPELVELLKRLNVVQVNIGFETGSDRMLRYLKNNSVTIEDHERAVKLLNESNILIYGNFMIGSPGETKEEMIATLDFFKNHDINIATLNITTPLPGTVIWEDAAKKGIVKENMDWSKFFNSLDKPEDQIYINEIVPHDEFMKIFKEFRSEIIKKSMHNWEKSASLIEMIKRFLRHPKNNIRVLIKNRREVMRFAINKIKPLKKKE